MSELLNDVQNQAAAIHLARETSIETPHGSKSVLVVEPPTGTAVDRARLDRIRSGELQSDLDEAIVRLVDARPGAADAILFRAHRGRGDHGWGYAADLTDAEVDELGEVMVRLQMDLYRRLAARGVYALAGTEFGEREVRSFRRGTDRVAAELERALRSADGPEAAQQRFDLWLLDHFAMWVDQDVDEFMNGGLPRLLDKVERQRRRLEELRAAIAAAV